MSPAFVAPDEELLPRTFVCNGINAKPNKPAVPCGFVLELALSSDAEVPNVKKTRPCPCVEWSTPSPKSSACSEPTEP